MKLELFLTDNIVHQGGSIHFCLTGTLNPWNQFPRRVSSPNCPYPQLGFFFLSFVHNKITIWVVLPLSLHLAYLDFIDVLLLPECLNNSPATRSVGWTFHWGVCFQFEEMVTITTACEQIKHKPYLGHRQLSMYSTHFSSLSLSQVGHKKVPSSRLCFLRGFVIHTFGFIFPSCPLMLWF